MRKLVVAGKIVKRNGRVVESRILAQPIAGMSQRWGMAQFDCKSGRHKECLRCRLDTL